MASITAEFYSTKRQHWKVSCRGKRAYPCEKLAEKTAIKIRKTKNRGEHVNPYECFFCGWWHLGHSEFDYHVERTNTAPDKLKT